MTENKKVNHLAIIPDGNRRWAKSKGLSTKQGHIKGYRNSINLVKKARELGITVLTFWAFSTENWTRSATEVSYLMKIYESFIDTHLKEALKNDTRLTHLGRKDRIPKSLLAKILNAEEKTKHFTTRYLNIALDYGGRDEILRAINKLLASNKIQETRNKLTEDSFSEFLDTGFLPYPDPDIIIRTSGEYRTSGFLPWQSVYSEFFFPEESFPDFTGDKMESIVKEYEARQRRFGK